MKARSIADNAPPLIRRVNFVWYPLALAAIVAIGWLSLEGVLPGMLLFLDVFFLFFWVFSLGFALYERFVRKKRAMDDR
jgi:hypothetical protein